MPETVPNSVRLSAPRRARIALVLSVLILFFGVALFSPLHKHTFGKANSCSFNNLEHQMVSLAEAAVVLSPVAFALEASTPPAFVAAVFRVQIPAQDRAPPSIS